MTDSETSDLIQLSRTLKDLKSEAENYSSGNLDSMSSLEIAELMNAEDKKVATAVGATLAVIGVAIEAAATALLAGGRIIYVGAGTSGRLGVLDAAEIPPTFSAPDDLVIGLIAGGKGSMFTSTEGAEDDRKQGAEDLAALNLGIKDFVVGLAASGRTPYVLGAVEYAKECGAVTAGISCNKDSELENLVDIPIAAVVGPEILAGSTRLKSGSAQKQILNMISTGAMVRTGKCYGNRMVDLNASNEKLKARAINLVEDLTPCSKDEAVTALIAADWNIKAAILINKTGVSIGKASQILDAQNGHLGRAIAIFKDENSLQLNGLIRKSD